MKSIIISILALIFGGSCLCLLAAQKKTKNKMERLKTEISIYQTKEDIQNYFLSSLSRTYLNSVFIDKRKFLSFITEFNESTTNNLGKSVFFVFSDGDCDACISNEMITLDSISKVFDGKIVVLKNTYKRGELIFLKNNFPSIPEIYPIPEHSYKSFFMENNTFPFYAFTKNNFAEITFFVPHADFPNLSKQFFEINLRQ